MVPPRRFVLSEPEPEPEPEPESEPESEPQQEQEAMDDAAWLAGIMAEFGDDQ